MYKHKTKEEITEEWWREQLELSSNTKVEFTINSYEPTFDQFEQNTFDIFSDLEKNTPNFFDETKKQGQRISTEYNLKMKSKKQNKMSKLTNSQKTVYNLSFDHVQYFEKKKVEKVDELPEEEFNQGSWQEDEIERFLIGFETLGRRWKKISLNFVKTRNIAQVASFGLKHIKSIQK